MAENEKNKYQKLKITIKDFYKQIKINENLLKEIEKEIIIKGEVIVFLNNILKMTATFIGIVDNFLKITNPKKEVLK